jgi:hypothetical protein
MLQHPALLYKGILVNNTGKQAGLPAGFAVYQGTIELMDARKSFLEDCGKPILRMLWKFSFSVRDWRYRRVPKRRT